MWPRSAEELARGRNSGFVCFMDRASAQRAMHGMQGKEFFGQTVRLDWGKPVALPAKPYFVLDKFLPKPAKTTTDSENKGSKSSSDPTIASTDSTKEKISSEGEKNTEAGEGGEESSTVEPQISTPAIPVRQPDEEIHVVIPDNHEVLRLIHRCVEFVLQYGHGFEEVLVMKHNENPSFLFLHDLNHPYHHYYLWKLYSLLQGDDTDDWRIRPFRMVSQGPYWIPPPCPKRSERESKEESYQQSCHESSKVEEDEDLPSSDSDLENEHYSRHASRRVLRRLRTLCKKLGSDRYSIARTMSFCIDASEAAVDMTAELARILQYTESSSHQLDLLYLVHDVLHNCTAPISNAWRYRDAFQHQLPEMLKAMAQTYVQLRTQSRWKAEGWRTDILTVVALWRQSMLYPRDYLFNLEQLFRSTEEAPTEEEKNTSSPFSSSLSSQKPLSDPALPATLPRPTIPVNKFVDSKNETKTKNLNLSALTFGLKSARTSAPKSSVFNEDDEQDMEN
ncbi:hypothetical protein HMI56_004168 [Coelomomyces lativittatus]|nr:hypothetical protein HMI56_004168 [Coelomomyces lativittatus]